ncbi:hypothetical protein LCI18_003198 [Fusarium solani-melongenae]|uniref:Uncharacterized protein n=1 Tax=Fusarium solani subsp. cucurbitae TaxID=2747967 RepID=A0ACD3YTT8_FUSSC|nr:hypothetical protein LCI18_003198 [Fusarium solani-melongenae]
MALIKVGIVGYGFSATTFHLPFILASKRYEIVAFLQRAAPPSSPPSPDQAPHCTVEFPDVKHYRNADDFFADGNIELVVVVTREDTHASFAEKALLAGKHAIVDKPFARSSVEADHVIQLAKEKKLVITCYQNRRWDSGFLALEALVQDNALGKIRDAEIHYDFEVPPPYSNTGPREYVPGGGMSFGFGSHNIDQALVLFGRPDFVTGFFRPQHGTAREADESWTIILQYAREDHRDNIIVTVKTTAITPLVNQPKFLKGTKCPQEVHLAEGKKPLDPGFGDEPQEMWGDLITYEMFDDKVQSYDKESRKYVGKYSVGPGRWVSLYNNLADAIQGKAELEVKATQSRDALRVIELARDSHDKGSTVPWS